MGSKTRARQAMQAAGVPIIPGTTDPVDSADEVVRLGGEIGYPLLIKAAAGGGGKGMRVSTDPDDFIRSFQLARSEALSAFGSGEVYIEKYLERPRHIEFQIMGDRHGNIIHLGERDCSVQRRHQKLIEEAPSPALTQDLRDKMGDAAVKGAKSIDYVGAGTIEMLLNEDKSFYFMEMNTRIQVEHPVTEMLTGVDIVKEQIRVASGAKLSIKPPIERRGHVIECRVNAEDPARNFQPSPGRIDVFHPPGGPGVRLDTHVYAGYTVPPFYDSLLAKLICQGSDRQEALRRMQVALESFIIEGITTTIPFLARVMANKHFQEGAVDTKFLERESELMKEPLSAA
jgi:acetyl-CoA carboxylase biotin carboxylase subunit